MVTSVTSLLKTVKTVEDEHQRGTRALEAAIEAIALEIRVGYFELELSLVIIEIEGKSVSRKNVNKEFR